MGISTQIWTTETFPVPNEWIFEKFLNLEERLTGQSVSIKSIFNVKDSNPSMIIFLDDLNKYRFKDFSTGYFGDGVEMIQLLYGLPTRQEAFRKVYAFYTESGETYKELPMQNIEKTVINVINRHWNVEDQKYWTAYHIGSVELEYYRIYPIKSYTFQIKVNGVITKEIVFEKPLCYGFYKKDGTLYKIYSPKDRMNKFLKIESFIQGHEQLQYKSDWLVLTASMKDLIAFRKLGFPIESIAPESENSIMSSSEIQYYKSKYKLITVLFDGDSAGKKNAEKYKMYYNLEYTNFDVEKDVAECVKEHGISNTKLFLTPLLLETKERSLHK